MIVLRQASMSKCDQQSKTIAGESVHLFRVSSKAIRRVIIGSRMSKSHEQLLLTVLAGNPLLMHVRLDRAEIDEREFRVNYLRTPKFSSLNPRSV